ncbi:hypothetical protein GO730_20960 [Spirosoma sp. HMF3257]|uniref:Uncharacterized protein n=1 Tax=Spirosoma telluris TaxID=2183553 RepID=A0A327NNP4_9BACT|nr:hypothetical protein [Spirosoma telluris]RAI76019.1 hypothetical protein HMF3257_20885 [Spirosoma telluris]
MTQYVGNARAVLDSLNSYEFLKARTTQLRNDLQASQTEKLGLRLANIRLKVSLDSCQAGGKSAGKLEGKLKAAKAENWVWRGMGLLALLDLGLQIANVFK